MAFTFLDLVNKLRRRLRDDTLGAFSGTDNETDQKDLINDACREILDEYAWDFMRRRFAQAYFPGRYTGTTLTATAGSTAGQVGADSEIADTAKWVAPRRSRIVHTNSSQLANVSYVLDDVTNEATHDFVLEQAYRGGGASGTGNFTLYTHELVLPSDVKQVTSIRDENRPLKLVMVEKDHVFDAVSPRPLDASGRPHTAYVGSGIESTSYNVSNSGSGSIAATQGVGLMIWPVPDEDVVLDYTYVAQHTELVNATDTLAYVPDAVAEAIVWVALDYAMVSNIEADAVRGRTISARTQRRINRLLTAYKPQPNRRAVMQPFGGRHSNRDYTRRWEDPDIPSP